MPCFPYAHLCVGDWAFGVGVGIGIDKTNGNSTPIPIPTPKDQHRGQGYRVTLARLGTSKKNDLSVASRIKS